MKNVTSKNLRRIIRIWWLVYVVSSVSVLTLGVVCGLILTSSPYAAVFCVCGVAVTSLLSLPFIIYFAKINKRFKEVMQTAETWRGILLGFKRSFLLGTWFAYMKIEGETYRTHSIFIGGYRNLNEAFALINKEVSYLLDGDKIYILGE